MSDFMLKCSCVLLQTDSGAFHMFLARQTGIIYLGTPFYCLQRAMKHSIREQNSEQELFFWHVLSLFIFKFHTLNCKFKGIYK